MNAHQNVFQARLLVALLFLALLLGSAAEVGKASPPDPGGSLLPSTWEPFPWEIRQFQTRCNNAPLVETTLPWPSDLHRAVSNALCNRPADILPGDYQRLILTSLDFLGGGDWATATVVMRPQTMPENYESLLLFPSLMAVMYRDGRGWHVVFEGTKTFDEVIQRSPRTVFSDEVKDSLLSRTQFPQGIPGSLNLKWPWKDGQNWQYTKGPHKWHKDDPVLSSLDFAPPWSIPAQNREIWASATGTVVRKCVDSSIQTDVILSHTGGYATGYLHIEKNSASHLVVGQTIVQQGGTMGITYNGQNWRDKCGEGSGPHLHFYVGRLSGSNFLPDSIVGTVISGWTLNQNGCFTKPGQQNICEGGWITSDNTPASLISIGQSVNGEINPAGERDYYYFSGTASQDVTIEMTKVSGSIDPYFLFYGPRGYITYGDDEAGFPNARKTVRLSDTGRYTILAMSYSTSQTGQYTLRVSTASGPDTDDNRMLSHDQLLNGTINPNTDEDTYYFSGIQGRIVSIRMNKSGGSLNSYLELYAPNGSFVIANDDGGGWDTRDAWLVTTLPQNGIYRVKARSYNRASSGAYTIRMRMVDANNFAYNGGASASSTENSAYAAFRAIDGNLGTRWSSRFSDPQWIQIDLRQNRTFDSVILRWETAYAKRYYIQVWTGSNWRDVAYIKDGRGGTVMIRFPRTTARYVRMYGVQRGTPWGYSLWEFGVYDSTMATVPTVPPEDPDQPPDTVEHTAPLPLPEEEQGKEVIALFLVNGEGAQEVEATPAEDPGETPTGTIGQEGMPTASIDAIIPGHPGGGVIVYPDQTLQFFGSAADNDADGDPGIVAYEWRSDRDGLLSTQAVFTMRGSALSPGEHVISFRAQDNEGNWSEWDRLTIQVHGPYRVYLPLVLR